MKLVNESLEDVLKPKGKEQIANEIGGNRDVIFKRSRKTSIGSHGMIGQIFASFKTLVKLFGPPFDYEHEDGDKITTVWIVEDNLGRAVEIYDYKATNLFYDENPSVEEFRKLPMYDWHIGGGEGLHTKFRIDDITGVKHNDVVKDLATFVVLNA
jgi:hypothetical protein